jgi:hypothetical protein
MTASLRALCCAVRVTDLTASLGAVLCCTLCCAAVINASCASTARCASASRCTLFCSLRFFLLAGRSLCVAALLRRCVSALLRFAARVYSVRRGTTLCPSVVGCHCRYRAKGRALSLPGGGGRLNTGNDPHQLVGMKPWGVKPPPLAAGTKL